MAKQYSKDGIHAWGYSENQRSNDLYSGVSKRNDLRIDENTYHNTDRGHLPSNNHSAWTSEWNNVDNTRGRDSSYRSYDREDLASKKHTQSASGMPSKSSTHELDKFESDIHTLLKEIEQEQSTGQKYIHLIATEKENINTKLQQLILDVDDSYNKIIANAKIGIGNRESASRRSDYSEKIKQLEGEVYNLQQELTAMSKEHLNREKLFAAEINRLKEEKRQLHQEAIGLSERLSKEMNTKVSSDETYIENISIKARPMKISEEYLQICSNQWLEAKTAVDETCERLYYTFSEDERVEFLCSILLTAQEEAKIMYDKAQIDIQQVLFYPMSIFSYRQKPSIPEDKLTNKMVNALGDLFRSNVMYVDCGPLIDKIESAVYTKNRTGFSAKIRLNSISKGAILHYITSAAELAWKMATQRPAMKFEIPGVNCSHNPDLQEIGWGSEDPSVDSVVDKYILPVLYHGPTVMAKGKVMLKKTSLRFHGATYGEHQC